MVEAHLLRAHQLAGNRGGGRRAHDLFDPRQPLPVAEVLEEPSRIVRAARDESAITRRGEVLLDRGLDERDLLGREGLPHADRAVAAERLD